MSRVSISGFGGGSGGGGGGAPVNAEYILGAPSGLLPNGRVVTNTPSVTWDLTTPGQAKANVVSSLVLAPDRVVVTDPLGAAVTSAAFVFDTVTGQLALGIPISGAAAFQIFSASGENLVLSGSNTSNAAAMFFDGSAGGAPFVWGFALAGSANSLGAGALAIYNTSTGESALIIDPNNLVLYSDHGYGLGVALNPWGPVFTTGLSLTVAAVLASSTVAFTDNAAGNAGTLGNAPAAGDPAKWIAINDNGTIRAFPVWNV